MKPCPFKCDNPKNIKPQTESQTMNDGMGIDPLWVVRCGHCDAAGPVQESEQEAIDAWDQRLPIPIGINDKHGKPIHIGDKMSFDPKVWGDDLIFHVTLEKGFIEHPGSTTDLSEHCEIIK